MSGSLSDNRLANETRYVKKSKVEGSSFEVGAKVMYEGREMTVSMAPDSDGDIKIVDSSGIMALAASLPECKSLTSLECAATCPVPFVQRPLNNFTFPCTHSISNNAICGLYPEMIPFGPTGKTMGTYTAEGIKKLCESLKTSSITSLRCAVSLPLLSAAQVFSAH